MQKLRVLIVSSGLAPEYGGSAVSEASMCVAMARYCHVSILCRADRVNGAFAAEYGIAGVVRYRRGEILAAWLQGAEWVHRLLDRTDVVHVNGHWQWEHYFLARLCRAKGIPYVLHPRGMMWVGHRRALLKRVFNFVFGNWIVRNSSRVIALSRFETRHFAPYSLPVARVSVIPNGITVGDADPVTPNPLGNLEQTGYFLYLGRLEKRKNLEFLLKAFRGYAARGGSGQLLLVGPSERGHEAQLRRRVDELDLSARVVLRDPIFDPERKAAVIRGAMAIIYPSREEAFGRVPFEAVAAGVPAIVPDASGSAEYLATFTPSTIYKSDDPEDLARVLGAVSGGTTVPGLPEATHWIRSALSWERVAGSLQSLYRNLLGQPA